MAELDKMDGNEQRIQGLADTLGLIPLAVIQDGEQ